MEDQIRFLVQSLGRQEFISRKTAAVTLAHRIGGAAIMVHEKEFDSCCRFAKTMKVVNLQVRQPKELTDKSIFFMSLTSYPMEILQTSRGHLPMIDIRESE